MKQSPAKPTYEELQARVAVLEKALAERSVDLERIGKLEEQNRIFEAVVSQSPAGIIISDEKGVIRYVNEAFTSTIAKAPEGKVSNFMFALLADESKSANYDDLVKAVQTGQVWRGEIKIAGRNRQVIWVRVTIFPLFHDGVLKNYVGIFNDVSTLKDLQTATQEKDAFYRTLIENLPLAIGIIDKKGKVLFNNESAHKMLKLGNESMTGKNMHEIFPKETADDQMRIVRRIFKTGKPINIDRNMLWNNQMVRFRVRRLPLCDEQGKVQNILAITEDITEHSREHLLLNIQYKIDSLSNLSTNLQSSLRKAFQNLLEVDWIDVGGIYVFDEDQKNLRLVFSAGLSKEYTRLVSEYSAREVQVTAVLKGEPIYASAREFFEPIKEALISEGLTFISAIPLIYKNKVIGSLNLGSKKVDHIKPQDRLFIESIASRLANLITLVKTQHELDRSNSELNTRLQELNIKQQILIQKSRLESLGELSAGLAHEINQPLTVISLAMENINYRIEQQQASGDYLAGKIATIAQNINKIKLLIEHVRIFSRDQGSITFERVDVNHVIINSLSMIESQLRSIHIDVITDLSEKIGYTIGNPSRFEQVMLNLLSNAKDALEEKQKKIPSNNHPREIRISTTSEMKRVVVKVRDSGTGISSVNLDKIFNPFFTTKGEGRGTGLGLPIVYGIISEMKGEISVNTEEGYYTEVIINLPEYIKM